jgi:hypothetical protein
MLVELMKSNMKGLSFGQLRLQEAVRYLDSTVTIYETTFETSVKEDIERIRIDAEARFRLKKDPEFQNLLKKLAA